MITHKTPLRYSITSWDQATKCRSNTSRDLHITISHFLNSDKIEGSLLQVSHTDIGTLFAVPINCSGRLLGDDYTEMSTDAILSMLSSFGFEIEYKPQAHLDGEQLKYLVTLNELGFDKIRTLPVHIFDRNGKVIYKPYIVAFKIESNHEWLQQNYSPFEGEFLGALKHGTAINISAISEEKKFRWDWLTYVANIEDILKDNCRE